MQLALLTRLKELFGLGDAQTDGYAAWQSGALDGAIEHLEAALKRRPGAPEALLPLARALAENGDASRALRLLDEAAARDPGGEAPILFRALILYDEGEMERAREEISHLPPDNLLGRAILGLLAHREGKAQAIALPPIALPPGAEWLPDVAGRLLAILEEGVHERDPEGARRYHHGLFYHGGDSKPAPAPAATSAPPERSMNPPELRRHLRDLFAAERFGDACTFCERSEAAEGWKDLDCEVYHVFSLLHSQKEAAAARLAEDVLRTHPGSADLHFLLGLAHIKMGRSAPAAWSFVRAARIADTELNQIVRELGERA